MIVRLALVLFAIPAIAGCGGPSHGSPERAAAEPGANSAIQPITERRAGDIPGNLSAPAKGDNLEESGALPAYGEPDEKATHQIKPPFRKWVDPNGKLLAVAEFIALQEGKVCLQKESGEGIVIAIGDLSQADRQFVNGQVSGESSELASEATGEEAAPNDQLLASRPTGPVENALAGPPQTPEQRDTSGGRKVVIPFDFVSKFDDGDYGRRVGEGIWTQLNKEGGFIIPESMHDVRELCTANDIQIGPHTPLEQVKQVVKRYFEAEIGIWGSVERVPGHEWDVYDLVIKCVDFSAPQPQVIYECNARTKVVSEIPHLYRKQMLDKLYDRQPAGPPPVDVLAEENWKNNPNLVVGDFQRGTRGVPTGWELVGGQQREPLGGLVSWVPEPGNPSNKVIRFTFDKSIGDSTGVMYYSDWFPIEDGAKYRFQCRYRTNGPSPKVFIKCYEEMESQYQAQSAAKPTQRREAYRSQQNLKGPKNTWNTQTEDFTPKHTKYTLRWGRVMLYAYLGGGVVEFDDVVVKQIVFASPGQTKRTPRHSMESPVTIEEMRENERRGQEARERMRGGRE